MRAWRVLAGILIFSIAINARGENPLTPEDEEIVEHMDFFSHMKMLELESEMSALAKLLDTVDGKASTEPAPSQAAPLKEPKK